MSDAQYMTFFTGGMWILAIATLLIAWQLWLMRDDRRDGARVALEGVGHELRINLHRMANEISQVAAAPDLGPDTLLPITHPQLNAVNNSMIRANRNGLAVIGATYLELQSRKALLKDTLAKGRDPQIHLDDAMIATIDGIAALYMWEEHNGIRPAEAGKVRSWDVRDWMKKHGFHASMLPGIHIRDEVVERLRQYGLKLTPHPLTHTAHEYYSMRYDRSKDPRAIFGKRDFDKEERKRAEKEERRAARQAKKDAKAAEKADHLREFEEAADQIEAAPPSNGNGATPVATAAATEAVVASHQADPVDAANEGVPLSERPLSELTDEELERALMEEGLDTEPPR